MLSRLEAERMQLHRDLQRCMYEIQQRDHYLHQLNTKVGNSWNTSGAAAKTLTVLLSCEMKANFVSETAATFSVPAGHGGERFCCSSAEGRFSNPEGHSEPLPLAGRTSPSPRPGSGRRSRTCSCLFVFFPHSSHPQIVKC